MAGLLLPVGPRRMASWLTHQRRGTPSTEPGTDFYCPIGTPVLAPADGVIWGAGTSIGPATGRWVGVNFDNGMSFRALHMSRLVRTSGRVSRGEIIAISGASGYGEEDWSWNVAETGGAHTHVTLWPTWDHIYGYRSNGQPYTIDFMNFVDGSVAGSESSPFLLEDDMPTMSEFLNTPAYDGGPTISQFFKAVDQGGVAAQVWGRLVDRGSDAGGNRLLIPAIQELADAKTLAMQILGKPVADVTVDVDEAAIAASLAPLITAHVESLSDEDVRRLSAATADELAKRLSNA